MIEKRDVSAMMRSVALVVQEYVGTVRTTLGARLDRLDAFVDQLALRQPEKGERGEKGDAGKDAAVDVPAIVAEVLRQIPPPEKGEPGKDATPVDEDALLQRFVFKIEPRLQPQKAAEMFKSEVLSLIIEAVKNNSDGVTDAITRGVRASVKDGKDGKDADHDQIRQAIESAVSKAVSGLPKPKDGEPGKDGRSVSVEELEAIADRAIGIHLSRWELDFERRAQERFERAIEKMPKPKDGKDGFSLEDMSVEHDGEGNVTLRFKSAELEREFHLRFPVFIYRGIFESGHAYRQGNGVTFGGSIWIALADDATEKPGTGTQWQLAVKKGRDGRDGQAPPQPGPVKL